MLTATRRQWRERDFCLGAVDAGAVYDRACRIDYAAPGFCLIDFGVEFDSLRLRRAMLELIEGLRRIHAERRSRELVVVSAGRFDQQTTTKFHRDGGPEESLLILGYEPTPVRAELAMADYSRGAADLGLTPAEFLHAHNPMYAEGAQLLEPYTTPVACFSNERWQILVINNSEAQHSTGNPTWQGVLHTAKILNPDPSLRRVVNSVMVASAEPSAASPVSDAELDEFATPAAVRVRR